MKRVFSGVQPSGTLTIGNYLGAIKQFVRLQETHECFYCVVDLHALTVPQDPERLGRQTLQVAAMMVASGLDPDKMTLFVQSHVRAHAELSWLLQCMTYYGELGRMTQFKDKARRQKHATVSAALFTYPVLQAADILLYDTHLVPVGEDQRQHLELTRDIAERFNNRYGETFVVPEVYIPRTGGRIMSLDNASTKMSKSNPNPGSYIALLDEPDVIREKIGRAKTDSGREVRYDPEEKPEISNLLTIYSLCSGRSIEDIEAEYEGRGYKDFKGGLAEAVIATLRPVQEAYHELMESGAIREILDRGADRAREIAETTLDRVKDRMGLVPRL